MLGLKLNHVSKSGPWAHKDDVKQICHKMVYKKHNDNNNNNNNNNAAAWV